MYSAVNRISSHTSDNFFNTTLGLTVKLGKNADHVMWVDPLRNIYSKIEELEDKVDNFKVCKNGDADNDGVCDDWDKQLDTPAGGDQYSAVNRISSHTSDNFFNTTLGLTVKLGKNADMCGMDIYLGQCSKLHQIVK